MYVSDATPSYGHSANSVNKQIALLHVLSLEAEGGTNIDNALSAALKLAEIATKYEPSSKSSRPMVIFLTDGKPTAGVTSISEIKKHTKSRNEKSKVPIFSLGKVHLLYNSSKDTYKLDLQSFEKIKSRA